MNLTEATAYLAARGYSASRRTVRELARSGRIRHRRRGIGTRSPMEFDSASLDQFLADSLIGDGPPPPKVRAPRVLSVSRPAARKAAPTPIDWRKRLDAEWGA